MPLKKSRHALKLWMICWITSQYSSSCEEAIALAPAMAASAFRLVWAPDSNGLSVVHLTKGERLYAVMWRLDCHLVLCNSDGCRGIQLSRQQCIQMQEME